MNDPHILGTERIGKLLVQYSIPAIIGMTNAIRCGLYPISLFSTY